MAKALKRAAINFLAPEVHVFNIDTKLFYELVDKISSYGYIGGMHEVDSSGLDFSTNIHAIVKNPAMWVYSSLYLHTSKIKKDRRVRALILKYRILEM
jgi:hypothetical protein